MICKNCGCQIADDSAFCINCGASVEPQPQPQYQQPRYAPQPQYVIQQQFVYEPPMSREYTKFIDSAGSAMSRAITSLVLTFALGWLYGVGVLIGFIMSLTVKGTIGKLKRLEINEEELVTQKSRENYEAAKRKLKTAKIISTINLIFILIPVFIGVILGLIVGLGIALGAY